MQPKEIVDLTFFAGEWSKCLSTKYQTDQLYRLGKFDDCSRQWKDVKTAVKAKLSRDEARAKELMEGTFHHQRTNVSPTAGIIWELKEKPGWEKWKEERKGKDNAYQK